jgi:hypothetical protein
MLAGMLGVAKRVCVFGADRTTPIGDRCRGSTRGACLDEYVFGSLFHVRYSGSRSPVDCDMWKSIREHGCLFR